MAGCFDKRHHLYTDNLLYKLTVEHPKTRLEFIKDVIDPLVLDYKEIEVVSVASQGLFPEEKTFGDQTLR